jgi:hypothetical protein
LLTFSTGGNASPAPLQAVNNKVKTIPIKHWRCQFLLLLMFGTVDSLEFSGAGLLLGWWRI